MGRIGQLSRGDFGPEWACSQSILVATTLSCCHNRLNKGFREAVLSRETTALGVGYVAVALIRIMIAAALAVPFLVAALV